jgi:broad specificity phosphatase PhoE
LVVGHGIVNRVLLAHWLGLPLRYARALPQDNGAYTILEFNDDKPKVRAMNVTASQVLVPSGDLTA